MSQSESQPEPKSAAPPREGRIRERGARDAMLRGPATALAVTLGCASLTWAAVGLTTEQAAPGPVAKAMTSCVYTLSDPDERVSLPPTGAKVPTRPYSVTLDTNAGSVVFESFGGDAPCATNSFVHLARQGYYDGSACHRVSTRHIFVLECGDPEGSGLDVLRKIGANGTGSGSPVGKPKDPVVVESVTVR
ncbi:peptidylprolyl isomerase [Streptomyces sp. SCSIO 30461]|uniref:peptidylprolyl isomerase n=1 Tax=Streptomyces sp. SCSIO 30461 TaxID=3118085 RepID=UPI0030D620D0